MAKSETFQSVLVAYAAQVERLKKAADAAHADSTSEEMKAEGKYDTRGTEAAYLAEAQVTQARKAQEGLAALQDFSPKDFDEDDEIGLGALVEVEKGGELSYFFLLPHGGGVTMDHHGFELTVISQQAPLYEQLIGCRVGDMVDELMILDLE